jgi:hypothetical protein
MADGEASRKKQIRSSQQRPHSSHNADGDERTPSLGREKERESNRNTGATGKVEQRRPDRLPSPTVSPASDRSFLPLLRDKTQGKDLTFFPASSVLALTKSRKKWEA